MATASIEGTVEHAKVRRAGRGQTIYSEIRIRRGDGGEEILSNHVAGAALKAALEPGSSGRFYTYKAIDHRGMHGFRDRAGGAVFAFPRNNERLFLILGLINAVLLAGRLILTGDIWLLPTAVGLLCAAGWLLARKSYREASRQFEADAAPPR